MAFKRSRNTFEADLQQKESPYVFFGTPLPPLDDHTRDDGSYVPVWQQEVTDDRGRKRLHGAFTGGFSAGYYNTVGSKEGWTPSAFVSSRQNRAKDVKDVKQQRAEDFMDEEDLREQEDSAQLSTAVGFAGFGDTENDPQRLGGIMDVFRSTGETMGIKLLKRMGWREGQGIGPRVMRKANLGDGGAESDQTHLFAPDNPPMISFVPKSDYRGVGYSTEKGLQSLFSDPRLPKSSRSKEATAGDDENGFSQAALVGPKVKKSKPATKSAFGVGVLNDTGSDDEDPYEIGPKVSYNRVIDGDKRSKKPVASLGGSNPLLKEKPILLSKRSLTAKGLSGFRKCHDGRLPPEGFLLSTEADNTTSFSIPEEFKPPEVPPDWKPARTAEAAIVPDSKPFFSVKDAAKSSMLDPKSRAAILGEAQLPGKSVFDYLKPAARDRIAHATGNTKLPVARNEKAPPGHEASRDTEHVSLQARVPRLDSEVALQALARAQSGWMPYSEDESKRSRYRSYLELRAGDHSDSLPPRAPGMSTDDYIHELSEFARAAQVFKPVTGLMASRFTSSTRQSVSSEMADGEAPTEALLTNPAAKPEDPAEAAARMGMFGHGLTRSVVTWYPTRLLCKRFNVPPPEHAVRDDQQGSGKATSHASDARYGSASRFQSGGIQLSENFEPAKTNPSGGMKLLEDTKLLTPAQPAAQNISEEDVLIDPNHNVALEQDRPGEAVFKAIFGDSDDEDHD